MTGPGVDFAADHREVEGVLPSAKGAGSFVYPLDFREARPLRDLREGEYEVQWTAWEVIAGVKGAVPIDVARDAFYVPRHGGQID